MSDYEKVIAGLTIFQRHIKSPGEAWFYTNHDEIRAGDSDTVTAEEKAELAELGWHDYGEGGFTFFI